MISQTAQTSHPDETADGLICALVLDGRGGARHLDWDGLGAWTPDQGVLWLHFDYSSETARRWIQERSGLDEIAAEALLTQETRPRTTAIDGAALLAMRGVNLNPGSEPEDMVSVRLWVDSQRIISTRRRRLISVSEIVGLLDAGKGPRSLGELLVEIIDRLTARVETLIGEIEDHVDHMEEAMVAQARQSLRSELAETRREAILLRRYLAPQREAVLRLAGERFGWLDEGDRLQLREVADRLVRYVEDLDSVRDRALVTQEELVGRLSEQMNNRMYVLSIAAAIFLPLGFLTGLLGINVGGIPGADNPWGFLLITLLLATVVAIQVWAFKRKGWF